MGKIYCSIGMCFSNEEKPFIAMGQVGHKVDRIVDENLSAFQYSGEDENELREILHKFVDDKIKAHFEILRVQEEGEPEPLPPNEFNDNIHANDSGVYNIEDILKQED